MTDELSTPIDLPDFTHLSVPELTSLRNHIAMQTKEARKKANVAIAKTGSPTLKSLWMNYVSLRSDTSAEDRRATSKPFYNELLRHPIAFLAYSYVNSLLILDQAIVQDMLRRSKVG